jgi:hypothetical protein
MLEAGEINDEVPVKVEHDLDLREARLNGFGAMRFRLLRPTSCENVSMTTQNS